MADVRKQSRSEEIVASIRSKILGGELVPGTRLIEQDIAREFGMSRGPVREALKKLEYEGLVVSAVNKGSTIASLTGEDAYEIFYLRGSLERMALEICGGKIMDSSILIMRNIIDDMKYEEQQGNNLQRKTEHDERFHEEIMKAAKMNRLHSLWKSLSPLNNAMFLKVEDYYRCQGQEESGSSILRPVKYRKKLWEAHEYILDVLEKGNLQDSIRVLEEHYLNTGTMIFRWEKRIEEKKDKM